MITLACGNQLERSSLSRPPKVPVEHSCVFAEFLVEFGVRLVFLSSFRLFYGAFRCSGLPFWLHRGQGQASSGQQILGDSTSRSRSELKIFSNAFLVLPKGSYFQSKGVTVRDHLT